MGALSGAAGLRYLEYSTGGAGGTTAGMGGEGERTGMALSWLDHDKQAWAYHCSS